MPECCIWSLKAVRIVFFIFSLTPCLFCWQGVLFSLAMQGDPDRGIGLTVAGGHGSICLYNNTIKHGIT